MSEKVIKDAVEAFNKADSRALGKLFGGKLGKGLENAMTDNRGAFPDLAYKIEHIVAEGDTVHFTYVAKGTNKGKYRGEKATNKTASWGGSGTAYVKDGKIVGLQTRDDRVSQAIQLGRKLGGAAQPTLTGNWQGAAQGITVTLQLVQSGNNVTGSATAFGSTFPVTGTVNYPNVSLSGTMNGLAISFTGAYNPPPNAIPGTLTALGSSIQVTINRQ